MLRMTSLVLLFLLISPVASSQSNTMFIIDGSGSMWGRLGDKAKIEIAKEALSDMLQSMPADARLGLMAYGHDSKENCGDIEVLAPIGSSVGVINERLAALNPKGKTPITESLKAAAKALPAGDHRNAVVLVSDGKETCGGDPCAAAAELAKAGVNLKIHVVGFDVQGEDREQLQCIAKAGGGSYFDANSTAGFEQAVASVQEEVERPPPMPTLAQHFSDDFDGEELATHWEVLNPNPDTFIVEDGSLLVINSLAGGLSADGFENLFRLSSPMPDGDWIATARLSVDFQTGEEYVYFGVFSDEDNYIVGHVNAPILYDMPSNLQAHVAKRTRGDHTQFDAEVWSDRTKHYGTISYDETMALIPQPILVRLEKKGRSYNFSVQLEGLEEPRWAGLPELTALRAKGGLSIGMYQAKEVKGESTMKVDWVRIEAPTSR